MTNEPTKEEKLIEFLKTVPDKYLLSEAGRRIAAKRSKGQSRPKVQRPCRFCGRFFGCVDMRKHLSSVHPGGKRAGNKLWNHAKPVGKECIYEGCRFVGSTRVMQKHVRETHFLKGD